MPKYSTFFLVVISLCFGCQKKIDKLQKPNILWIVADDLGPDLGCYGSTLVQTPNIDLLAQQSILFENCHTTTAVCSPSRSGMITGMYPVSIHCQQHRTRDSAMRLLPEKVKVITEYFEGAGYFTFNGKYEDRNAMGKTDYNFVTEYKIYDGTDWTQRAEGQPFFGQIQIHFPHRPFERDTINPIDASKVALPLYIPNHWIARRDWANYLETVQMVDRQVGEVLKRLRDEGLANNTFVFFVGDQGRPMVREKQFLYDGGTHTPLLVRYPNEQYAGTRQDDLVSNIDLSVASMKLAGISIPEHVQGIDFLEGNTSRKKLFTMRDRRDETVDRIRAVRTKTHKLIQNYMTDKPYTQYNAYKKNRYPTLTLMQVLKVRGELTKEQEQFLTKKKPAIELYDLKNDPYELHNLAEDERLKSIKNELLQSLNQFVTKYDVGNYPEDQKEIDYWTHEMGRLDTLWKSNRGLPANVSNDSLLKWWEHTLK